MPDRWDAVLEDLEHRLAVGDLAEWAPPAGLDPMPRRLEQRARVLLARQQDALTAAEAELARVGGELAALRRPSAVQPSHLPAFIDTVA
ncbi:hypothetical protein [Naasia sp. SYSU D00057]|uniref:hypothetical protein n=1 Tax=Naasia sp. SYSU D00057 TaxID=2817380 RepID=UPI001B309D52|nr:hypothetical protein [Naasia sp. SYSU D00057]